MKRFLRVSGWVLMLLLASMIALVSLRYFFMSPVQAAGEIQGEKFARYVPLLLTHVGGGVVALILGPWQFWSRLRNRFLSLHRWVGRLYLLGIFAGGLAGLAMAFLAFGGLPARTGFGSLAVAWLVTGFLALQRIRQGNVRAHREWMIRSYALTLAAVTLRIWLPLLEQVLGFTTAYPVVAWLCWVPNLLVVEVYLRGVRGRKGAEVLPLRSTPLTEIRSS